MNTHPMLSIVIPSYRGQKLLKKHFPTVVEAVANAKLPIEIIVVDDGGGDDTAAFMNKQYPSVLFVQHEQNKGFAATCNTGARAAKGDILVFLNNDMDIDKNCFSHIPSHFRDQRLFGLRLCIIARPHEPYTEPQRLRVVPRLRYGFIETPLVLVPDNADTITLTVSGGAAAIDRRKFWSVGGFDERFSPFYWEDTDLSLRAWLAGYEIRYEPRAIVYHYTHATISSLPQAYVKRVSARNRYYLAWKYLPGGKAATWHAAWLVPMLLRDLIKGKLQRLGGLCVALPEVPHIAFERSGLPLPYSYNDIAKRFSSAFPEHTVL